MLLSKFNRRRFISTAVVGALATVVAYGYYQYSERSAPVTQTPSLRPRQNMPATVETPASTYSPPPTNSLTPPPNAAYLAVAQGKSPTRILEAAIKALGGIERFVKPGNDVIIKPNICVSYRSYEYAATTNPEVVAALTALSLEAGAKRVRVMDHPFGGTPEQAYATSGIEEAVRAAGGQMEIMSSAKYREVDIPNGKDITRWPLYGDILDADVLINVPIAKQHSLGRLTLGMKNLLGIVQDANRFHSNLGQRLADLYSLVRPTLTVVDAVRILVDHGPTGGSLDDVKMTNTVLASHDVIAADSYAATLFGLTGADISAVSAGAQMGLGTMDLSKVRIEEIDAR
jgi:uncharacterized protein (DUF362 family)